MPNGYDYKKYAVLYVDDEEKSLKYFRKAYEKDFKVITASSASEALKVLERESEGVGIVITDQRMPGQTGVELLGRVRNIKSKIIRMLTTAYSDLDGAIDAVNSGAIFKYVVKPWNVRELRGYLLRGMEFFLIQEERDTLLREKLSILQRMIITDRIHSLAVLAAGLSHQIRNPMTALKTFLDLAPKKLLEELPESTKQLKNPAFWGEFWAVAQRESERILHIIESVAEAVVEPSQHFDGAVHLNDLIGNRIEGIREQAKLKEISIQVDIVPDLPLFKADEAMMGRLFTILFKKMVQLNPLGKPIFIRAHDTVPIWGTQGTEVLITGGGPKWTDDLVASLFTAFSLSEENYRDLGLDLLPAFFIAHHHNGDLLISKEPPEGPGFKVILPFDPRLAERPSIEDNCMKKIISHFMEV